MPGWVASPLGPASVIVLRYAHGPEPAGKAKLIVLAERLIPEHQNLMGVPGILNRCDIDVASQIDAGDFGAEGIKR